jgi:hypothetical protein
MSVPSEILSGFTKIQEKTYGTRFFAADLHFHTPSSSDGRGKDKYGFNPYGISYQVRRKAAGADLLSDLKSLDSLEALRDRADILALDLKVLEMLESKVLNDILLLEDIQELKTIPDPADRTALEARIRQEIDSINDLKDLSNVDWAFLDCDDIQTLAALKSQPGLDLFTTVRNIEGRTVNELKSKYYDLRLLRDLKYFRSQVPGEGYPVGMRSYQDRLLAYSRLKADQIVKTFLDKKLSLVAVTDHNGMGTLWNDDQGGMDLTAPTWYELIDDAAQKVNASDSRTRLVILPGVEISTNGVHILAIFPPQKPRRRAHFLVCELLSEVGIPVEEWCINMSVGTLSPFDTINLIVQKGGIAIPAHIDGTDQALLNTYKLTSGAVKDVVGNALLRAVEVINPRRFQQGPVKDKLEDVRRKNNLSSLAYFQGSDSHQLLDIAKRSTILKMTAPSFEGLRTAIKIPSSRVRFTSDKKDWDGLYLRGMVFDHPFLGRQVLRFNRNLNCIAGRVGVGKSTLHNLIKAAANPTCPYPINENDPAASRGSVALFVEKLNGDQPPGQYAYYRKAGLQPLETVVRFYSLGEDGKKAVETRPDPSLQPGFYNAERIMQIVDIEQELDAFLCEHFKIAPEDLKTQDAASILKFNKLFSLPRFFEDESRGRLLELQWDKTAGRNRLMMNLQWRVDKPEWRKFSSLGLSQRRAAILCMVIRNEDFGPVIIDEPEHEFDNEDMIRYLVPLILEFKEKRQVLLFTNHPLLAVNTDPDNYLLLSLPAKKEGPALQVVIDSGFAIDAGAAQKDLLIKVLEGDLESVRKRLSRYE